MEQDCEPTDSPEEIAGNEYEQNDDINEEKEEADFESTEERNDDIVQTETDKRGKNTKEENENNLSSIQEKYGNLRHNLEEAVSTLRNKMGILQIEHFKDLPADFTLIDDVKRLENLCSDFVCSISDIFPLLKDSRECLMNINKTINDKITNEGLYSWLRNDYTKTSDLEEIAQEKKELSEAAQARLQLAEDNAQLAAAGATVSKFQTELTEAEEAAQEAIKEAEKAAEQAEQARIAAEEKRKAEEEARKKAEEEQRKKELEEAEKKRKEEEMKRKREEQTENLSPEEEARRNPANWPMFIYSIDPGDLDIPIGCVFRAMQDSLSREDIEIEKLNQKDDTLKLNENEELVGHIIQLRFTKDDVPPPEEPYAIALAHVAPKNPTREVVIKSLDETTNKWVELPTNDVQFEDIKEYRFVEARLKNLTNLVVVTKLKRERFITTKKGGKLYSTVDPRISLSIGAGLFKVNTNIELEVQPVDLGLISELRFKYESCSNLLASSPIVNFSLLSKKLSKPILVGVPVHPNHSKPKRPQTAVTNEKERNTKARPSSAAVLLSTEEENEDLLHLLSFSNGCWQSEHVALSQPKNKDIVTFEIKETVFKFLILRTKRGHTDVERIAHTLEKTLGQKSAQLIIRQSNENLNELIVQCINSVSSKRILNKLIDEGYETGPDPSNDLIMKEGDVIRLGFRGNIEPEESFDNYLVYNSQIRAKLNFLVTEIDKFAQKSIDCYRGFVQFYSKKLVKKALNQESKDSSGRPKNIVKYEEVEEEVLLAELLVKLPKPDPGPPKPLNKAPVGLKAEGHDVIDLEYLKHLSEELGEEWKKLASYLNVKKVRIQAIMRNNINSESENAVYDMLVTWAKKVPRSVNKVDVLCTSLLRIGRADLVEELKDRDSDFRIERAKSARTSIRHKAFLKVAKNGEVAKSWKKLAKHLGLSDSEISNIDTSSEGNREKCLQALNAWHEKKGSEEATISYLANQLKRCRFRLVADEIQAIK
ncbi:DgyrCDS63 [Dimorphilus gyrociliatus]|uniref:DgyrCDS63 n=1 Tax=Dimorphilus gyrociliatus TaxID=2664684 RepID=A0A7I8V3R3_9ANNE|nr:DgyrCDS63 [Dimorphilus gyrociliatus]